MDPIPPQPSSGGGGAGAGAGSKHDSEGDATAATLAALSAAATMPHNDDNNNNSSKSRRNHDAKGGEQGIELALLAPEATTVGLLPSALVSPLHDDDEDLEPVVLADEKDDETAEEAAERRAKEEAAAKELAMFNAVPFGKLFRFADNLDVTMMCFGTLGAVGAGALFPAFSLIFGQLLDDLNGDGDFMTSVINLAYTFLYMGAGMGVGAYLSVSMFMTTSERQSKIMREEYLSALLRQEIGWHDMQNTGDLAVKLTSETRKVQDGLGDKYVNTASPF